MTHFCGNWDDFAIPALYLSPRCCNIYFDGFKISHTPNFLLILELLKQM